MAAGAALEQRVDLQLAGSGATWAQGVIEEISLDRVREFIAPKRRASRPLEEMYARLAREFDAEPAVHTRSGGLPGELIKL